MCAAILEFRLPVTSHITKSSIVVLEGIENMGTAIGIFIAILSTAWDVNIYGLAAGRNLGDFQPLVTQLNQQALITRV